MSDKGERDRRHFVVENYFAGQLGGAQFRRRAKRQAGYLLDYIEPHHKILDVGCGPGAITAGFSSLVPDGSVIGIDTNAEQIAAAQTQYHDANTSFQVVDVYKLPFAERSFDVVHAHAVFQHLHEPLQALSELHRVLKPGGIIGIGDWDKDAVFLYPHNETLVKALGWVQIANGQANSKAGRQIAEHLAQAGFDDPAMSVTAQGISQAAMINFQVETFARTFEDEALKKRIVELGLASQDELDLIPDRWRDWGQKPGAIYMTHWFFGVAFR